MKILKEEWLAVVAFIVAMLIICGIFYFAYTQAPKANSPEDNCEIGCPIHAPCHPSCAKKKEGARP